MVQLDWTGLGSKKRFSLRICLNFILGSLLLVSYCDLSQVLFTMPWAMVAVIVS